jgi:hypothetical protein
MKPTRFHPKNHFSRMLQLMWQEACYDYELSGMPFGSSNRALDLWIMYGTQTTRN